jgi:uncharacterized damage-inducible protein DinB
MTGTTTALVIWPYIARSVDQILDAMEGLTAEELNLRPAPGANSLYVLATHMLGNLNESMLGTLCRQDVTRDRDAEFVARGAAVEEIRRQWLALHKQITEGLAQLPGDVADTEYDHPRRGKLSGLELLLVVARHAAEHQGHAELTRQLLLDGRT